LRLTDLESNHDESNVLPATIRNAARREDSIKIRSTANETFAQIGPYLDALVQAMSGPICPLEDDGEGRFLRCFICLSACKEAFYGWLSD
jgi:hypothetical protein